MSNLTKSQISVRKAVADALGLRFYPSVNSVHYSSRESSGLNLLTLPEGDVSKDKIISHILREIYSLGVLHGKVEKAEEIKNKAAAFFSSFDVHLDKLDEL